MGLTRGYGGQAPINRVTIRKLGRLLALTPTNTRIFLEIYTKQEETALCALIIVLFAHSMGLFPLIIGHFTEDSCVLAVHSPSFHDKFRRNSCDYWQYYW